MEAVIQLADWPRPSRIGALHDAGGQRRRHALCNPWAHRRERTM